MTMNDRNNNKRDSYILSTIDELVPQDHLVRKLEEAVDWTFIYPLVRNLYRRNGRPSIDPVVLFKMMVINFTFGYNSMRKTCKEIEVNIAYRWFIGYSIEEKIPNYSTWSQNYIRRYGNSEVFDKIFNHILEEAMNHGFIKADAVFGDGTHTKACANRNKHTRKEVEIVKKAFEDELLEEINQQRKADGNKEFKFLTREELDFDSETGEQVKTVKKRN